MVRDIINLRRCSRIGQWGNTVNVRVASLLAIVTLLLVSGCATLPTPQTLVYINGAKVETLSSNASLSFAAAGRTISGSGVLMYRAPEQLRMVVLTPFGSVFQEVFVVGEQVTIIDPGNSVAFQGNVQELPTSGDVSGWRYLRWVLDIDVPDAARGSVALKRTNRFGEIESAVFDHGLLLSKTTESGALVRYDSYVAVNGVAVPLEISCETARKERFTIKLDEPDVNGVVEQGALLPKLADLKVYPLSVLR